ncbi:MAG TPA: ketosteroid isomerase-related protein [Kofleriaceae bacterium]|nr:ketosteroid isomerase-related protein [Kofleriaceae bacterium]
MPTPTDDVSLVRRYYERFNSGDWDGMCALLADDVQHDLNQGAREIGRGAFRAFLDKMASAYQEQLHDIVVMGNGAGRVAAEYVVVGAYLADDKGLPPAHGQRYRLPGGAFFSVENGAITRVTNYYNLEDWLAQVRAWPTP